MPPMRIEFMTFGLQDQRSATEPWTYRTAADCSTTELYPQAEQQLQFFCFWNRDHLYLSYKLDTLLASLNTLRYLVIS